MEIQQFVLLKRAFYFYYTGEKSSHSLTHDYLQNSAQHTGGMSSTKGKREIKWCLSEGLSLLNSFYSH